MKNPSFHSSHYFNSPLNLQFRHLTNFLRILFSRAHFREILCSDVQMFVQVAFPINGAINLSRILICCSSANSVMLPAVGREVLGVSGVFRSCSFELLNRIEKNRINYFSSETLINPIMEVDMFNLIL